MSWFCAKCRRELARDSAEPELCEVCQVAEELAISLQWLDAVKQRLDAVERGPRGVAPPEQDE